MVVSEVAHDIAKTTRAHIKREFQTLPKVHMFSFGVLRVMVPEAMRPDQITCRHAPQMDGPA